MKMYKTNSFFFQFIMELTAVFVALLLGTCGAVLGCARYAITFGEAAESELEFGVELITDDDVTKLVAAVAGMLAVVVTSGGGPGMLLRIPPCPLVLITDAPEGVIGLLGIELLRWESGPGPKGLGGPPLPVME